MVDGGGGDPPGDPSAHLTPLRETVSDGPLPADTLRDAVRLDWTIAPVTAPVRALIETAAALAAASEVRGRARGPGHAAAFRQAIGAIVGAALGTWWRHSVPVSHSRKASAFTGQPIGARTALAALDALTAAGLLIHHPGFRRELMPGAYGGGWVSRWHPCGTLLALAEAHAVAPGDAADAFRRVGAETIRPPPPPSLVEVKPLGKKGLTGRDLADAAEAVAGLNERAATVPVRGCPLPVFRRTFHGTGHGRFYALGGGAVPFQRMAPEDRLRDITIAGEAVAEVDARASHLTILHALAGMVPPSADPYAFPGIPRGAVKAFVTMTCGAGKPAVRWSRDIRPAQGWPPLADIRAAVLDRFPFMRCPALLVPAHFHSDVPRERALSHYLTRIEADALATAMGILWRDHGTLALPLHDCLLVPRSAVTKAAEAIRMGYLVHAGEEPRVSASWWEDGRKASHEV
jgi:hypothetical protein